MAPGEPGVYSEDYSGNKDDSSLQSKLSTTFTPLVLGVYPMINWLPKPREIIVGCSPGDRVITQVACEEAGHLDINSTSWSLIESVQIIEDLDIGLPVSEIQEGG